MSDVGDAVQDFTTGLFDFATSPFRAIGNALFPSPPRPIPARPTPTPGISDVQARRSALLRQQGRRGRASLILTQPNRSRRNTGQRPLGGQTLGGGGGEQ